MKLADRAFDQLIQADIRFNRFDEKFKLFLQQLAFFNESTCPLKGVKIEIAPDARSVAVKYRTVVVTFRLIFQLNQKGSTSARVECALDQPNYGKVVVNLGAFTFNPLGITDFEPDGDDDPIDLEAKGPEIIIHFLTLALQHNAI